MRIEHSHGYIDFDITAFVCNHPILDTKKLISLYIKEAIDRKQTANLASEILSISCMEANSCLSWMLSDGCEEDISESEIKKQKKKINRMDSAINALAAYC